MKRLLVLLVLLSFFNVDSYSQITVTASLAIEATKNSGVTMFLTPTTMMNGTRNGTTTVWAEITYPDCESIVFDPKSDAIYAYVNGEYMLFCNNVIKTDYDKKGEAQFIGKIRNGAVVVTLKAEGEEFFFVQFDYGPKHQVGYYCK